MKDAAIRPLTPDLVRFEPCRVPGSQQPLITLLNPRVHGLRPGLVGEAGVPVVRIVQGDHRVAILAERRVQGSPMTYLVDGRQYVAVAAGSQILAFALR